MAMGKRKRQRQQSLWVETGRLAKGPSHPFYRRLNQILAERRFDDFVEATCQRFYSARVGRPSLPPAVYFRLLLIGYFEGIDSERGIAWRVADSIALRDFLGYSLTETTPDHSTISRNRRLIDLQAHQEVFTWVLQVLAKSGLLKGETLGIDATTLEANAALRSIVRRDTGESYREFLTRLAQASGIEAPTREDLARLDRNRSGKGSNDDWQHPQDTDARITKMKNGQTHLAHKAEHAVVLETGAVVAVTVQPADRGGTTSVEGTLQEAMDVLADVSEDKQAAEGWATRCSRRSWPIRDITATPCSPVASEWGFEPTFRSRAAAGATGAASRPSAAPPTRIAGGSGASGVSASCDCAVSGSSAPSPIVTRRAGCAERTCEAIATSPNVCWSIPLDST
jgi:transposase